MASAAIASQQAHVTTRIANIVVHFLNYCATYPDAIVGNSLPVSGKPTSDPPRNNRAVNTDYSKIKVVIASAAEAKLGALFTNCKVAVEMCIALEELEHKQQATALIADNSAAFGFINEIIKQCKNRAIDVRFYWLKSRSK
eukprot:13303455-Ditylum_brightwellii.AAC.1